MKKYRIYSSMVAVVFVIGAIYGIIIVKYHIFPYSIMKNIYQNIHPSEFCEPWSIGIYEGSNLMDLSENEEISNPVLTAKNVSDINAAFVADPFMVVDGEKYFIFFEVLNQETNQGDIAYAESTNGAKWNYKKVVIDEIFHLSYPYIFYWNDTYYMIPESNEDFSVRLYKAVEFPEKWEYAGNLLSGYSYIDPSIFRYKNKWWMFVGTGNNNVLNLYFSENLSNGWRPHPKNPIVKLNEHFSRPGGRVVQNNGKLLRFAQDDSPYYGIQTFAFEITELSDSSYAEKLFSRKPIITKTDNGWNATGMHHIDPHKVGNRWIAVVDGK